MGDMIMKVRLDMAELKKDIKKAFSDVKLQVGGAPSAGGSGSGSVSSGGSGKTGASSGIAGGIGKILKALGPLAILTQVQFISDTLKIIVGFIGIGVLKVIEFIKSFFSFKANAEKLWAGFMQSMEAIKNLWESTIAPILSNVWESIKSGFTILKERFISLIKDLPGKIWNFLKELPSKIWNFIKDLPGKIWDSLKAGFSKIYEVLQPVIERINEFLAPIKETIANVWAGIKEVPEKIWNFMKELPQLIWNFLTTGFTTVKNSIVSLWNSVKSLPKQIWDYVKQLGSIIASKIKSLNPFKKEESVNDAIITKGGKIVRTNPQDTIIATKTPGAAMGGGHTFNFYGVTEKTMIEKVKQALGSDANRIGGF